MKTLNFLPTVLAFCIPVMMISQTQNNQPRRILSVLGNDKKEFSIKSSSIPAEKNERKIYPTLLSSEDAYAAKENKQPANVIDNNTFNYYNNSNCYATEIYASELIKQAEDLGTIESTLRNEAKTKQGEEKNNLVKAANELFRQGEIKLIQASEIKGKINLEKFNSGKIIFNNLILTSLAAESITQQAKEIESEAHHSFKMAKEMREEAYAMPTNSAKLGTMGNAEEKETIALGKQNKAITILKQYAALQQNIINDLAVK